ncbi:MAG: glycine--tRNA ligase subunit beta [Rhizomicrobium sp.]
MSELFIELFSEEIPARMQTQAAKDLERLVTGALKDNGLVFTTAHAHAASRRLALVVDGVPAAQPDVHEEKKGPRVGAPEKAVEGFLRSAGLSSLDQCTKQSDAKGEFYVAVIEKVGRPTAEVLREILPAAFAQLPWPKSMRFPGSELRWVRPLHAVTALFDGAVVPFSFCGITSGNTTRGHRFLSQGDISVTSYTDYVAKLRAAHVLIDAEERKNIIWKQAQEKAAAEGFEVIEDRGLLEEVAGLAEWPVVLIGAFEEEYLSVPGEILQTSMRVHQKYFALRDPKTKKLVNRFAVVANMVAEDGGKAIVAGNGRVLRARLSDAKFFWDQDRKVTLESRVKALEGITFHAKLGTQFERVERIVALAGVIAEKIGADVEKAKRAALLAKADLTSGVVGEFPELQGIMGGYYAQHDGEDAEVAAAVAEHYKPLGPTDTVPTAPVSMAVALADKLDQLTGFFSNDLKPTGSSDPYALRRAALGVVRIILTSGVRVKLKDICDSAAHFVLSYLVSGKTASTAPVAVSTVPAQNNINWVEAIGILPFFADRLKVALKEQGIRYDLIDAVLSLGAEDDLVRLVARVEALQEFLKSDNGKNLLAAYKRAANILKAEEKKDKRSFDGAVDTTILNLPEEKALCVELMAASNAVKIEIADEHFVDAMRTLSRLRGTVDAFFEKVTVNDKDAALRENRLNLLATLRATLHLVADFSKIAE